MIGGRHPLANGNGKVGFLGATASGREGARENTGNFIHGYSARLMVENPVNITNLDPSDAELEAMEAEFTHLSFVAATTVVVNNVDVKAPAHLKMARIIERLKLPVVVFGLGSQSRLGQSVQDAQVGEDTLAFLRVLSEHSETIAVRGEFTADLCRSYGVTNVEVLGCQSCFMSMTPDFRFPEISGTPDLSRSVVNVTYHSQEVALLNEAMAANAHFIGQSSHFEYALRTVGTAATLDDLPVEVRQLATPGMVNILSDGRLDLARFQNWVKQRFHQFYDVPAWLRFLSDGVAFSVGTRFHGNMASLQAGVPALWIVHDNRTKEFCEYLGLPHAPIEKVRRGASFTQLVEDHFDTGEFQRKYRQNYARFYDYLDRSGLRHFLRKP